MFQASPDPRPLGHSPSHLWPLGCAVRDSVASDKHSSLHLSQPGYRDRGYVQGTGSAQKGRQWTLFINKYLVSISNVTTPRGPKWYSGSVTHCVCAALLPDPQQSCLHTRDQSTAETHRECVVSPVSTSGVYSLVSDRSKTFGLLQNVLQWKPFTVGNKRKQTKRGGTICPIETLVLVAKHYVYGKLFLLQNVETHQTFYYSLRQMNTPQYPQHMTTELLVCTVLLWLCLHLQDYTCLWQQFLWTCPGCSPHTVWSQWRCPSLC